MAPESTRRPPTRPIPPVYVSPPSPTALNGSTRTQQPGSSRPRGRKGGRSRHLSSSFMNPKPHYQNPYDQITEAFNDLQVPNDDGDDDDNNKNGFINSDAYDDIPVEISGSNIPKAVVNTFSELDLAKSLSDNIVNRCKFVKPTPVQKHALPIALAGRDLMACAQTGSGKTAAFCFPIISSILRMRNDDPFVFSGRGSGRTRMACPCALILSPTRELSCQIHTEAQKFAYNTGVKIAVAYGGAPILNQLRNMEKGVDILVATPGRLVDMIERGRVSLRMVKYLALDEADRMLDMGFEPQIRRIVEQMDMPKPGVRQTMLFSATFPVEIQRLASDFLSDYIFLTVGRVGSSTDLIAQRVELVQDTDKRSRLMVLLRDQKATGTKGKHRLTLVFVETKKGADALERWLSMKGFPAIAIHGDKVQMERERALKSFKSGQNPILVATDVASRGLDIPHVSHVINFDLPKDIDNYVHRIGRTGRAGKSGTATAFFSDKNMPLAKALAELMKEANQEVPLWLNQYAENSSNWVSGGGSSRHHGRSKYGGFDFRSDAKSYSDNNYYPAADSLVDSYASSGAYGDVSAGSTYNSASAAYDVSSNNYTAPVAGDANYGFSTGSGSYDYIVASGWD